MERKYAAVVIGASAGGAAALAELLPRLPGEYPLPVIIVQHLHPLQEGAAALYGERSYALPLKEAEDKEPIRGGCIYFAPPNYHLLIEEQLTFALSVDEKVNYARQAIDVLFESAADVYGPRLIGVVLSGANHDGARGLWTIKERGGVALVQAPETAEVAYMPRLALQAVQDARVMSPARLGETLVELAQVFAGRCG